MWTHTQLNNVHVQAHPSYNLVSQFKYLNDIHLIVELNGSLLFKIIKFNAMNLMTI